MHPLLEATRAQRLLRAPLEETRAKCLLHPLLEAMCVTPQLRLSLQATRAKGELRLQNGRPGALRSSATHRSRTPCVWSNYTA